MRTRSLTLHIIALFMLLSVPDSIFCAESWQIETPSLNDLYAVWGTSDKDIYVGGAGNTLLYCGGESWELVTQIANITPMIDIRSLWGVPLFPVYVTGDAQGLVFMNDGLSPTWFQIDLSTLTRDIIYAMWGSSTTNIFAVGSYGTIIASNGSSWTLLSPSITFLNLYCIWGSSEINVYAGGEIGSLFHYDGTSWKSVSSGTGQDIKAIWGASESDIYATGSSGAIIHFDGSIWSTVDITSSVELDALWGSAGNDVFAAGKAGTIYHYDGSDWNKLVPPAGINNICAAWGSTSGKVYFACQGGSILMYTRDDHISPVINYSEIPGNNGTAYIDNPITFHFSEEMSGTTINSSSIILKSGSTTLPARTSLSSDHMSLKVSGDLAYSTAYTVTVKGGSSGVKDSAGNELKADYVFSFTTEAEPDDEPGSGSDSSGCFIASGRL